MCPKLLGIHGLRHGSGKPSANNKSEHDHVTPTLTRVDISNSVLCIPNHLSASVQELTLQL